MTTKEQLTAAFEAADSILALEGMVKPGGHAALEQAVIEGRMTFDEAIASVKAEYATKRLTGNNDKNLST